MPKRLSLVASYYNTNVERVHIFLKSPEAQLAIATAQARSHSPTPEELLRLRRTGRQIPFALRRNVDSDPDSFDEDEGDTYTYDPTGGRGAGYKKPAAE